MQLTMYFIVSLNSMSEYFLSDREHLDMLIEPKVDVKPIHEV